MLDWVTCHVQVKVSHAVFQGSWPQIFSSTVFMGQKYMLMFQYSKLWRDCSPNCDINTKIWGSTHVVRWHAVAALLLKFSSCLHRSKRKLVWQTQLMAGCLLAVGSLKTDQSSRCIWVQSRNETHCWLVSCRVRWSNFSHCWLCHPFTCLSRVLLLQKVLIKTTDSLKKKKAGWKSSHLTWVCSVEAD